MHPTEARDVGGYYYLLTTQTQKEIAAVSCPREDGRMVFKPHGTFIESYVPHLMLGGELEWESEDNLAVWLNVVVHNSFMYSSIADFAIGVDTIYTGYCNHNLDFIETWFKVLADSCC
ncbi:hypothetical protein RHGRI_028831 [Rhododendron griersonianum]|uniref:Uncharacterized protein n=1 Tax=Rhododendron griersonianum TaxID=479676 RepID=A0AAV6IH94_9ERIC|nr:hypothetical protein RHGRI_028831 [Rhododendron griersonianum]